MYVNGMCNTSMLLKSMLFADDTSLFCKGRDLNMICETVSTELNKLNTWFKDNKLSLNIYKINVIVFGKTNTNNCRVTIEDVEIEQVKCTKFLGVHVDAKLSCLNILTWFGKKSQKIFMLCIALVDLKRICAFLFILFTCTSISQLLL